MAESDWCSTGINWQKSKPYKVDKAQNTICSERWVFERRYVVDVLSSHVSY
jgi:hypothetical protein